MVAVDVDSEKRKDRIQYMHPETAYSWLVLRRECEPTLCQRSQSFAHFTLTIATAMAAKSSTFMRTLIRPYATLSNASTRKRYTSLLHNQCPSHVSAQQVRQFFATSLGFSFLTLSSLAIVMLNMGGPSTVCLLALNLKDSHFVEAVLHNRPGLRNLRLS